MPIRYGWIYTLNSPNSSDGSTMGWSMLGLEVAQAAGAQIPAEVKTRLAKTLVAALNNDGSLDYQADNNPASDMQGEHVKGRERAAGPRLHRGGGQRP